MKKFTLRHEIRCSEERFWQVFFYKEFNSTLFKNELGFPVFEVVEQSESDAEVVRKVRGQPKVNMPKAVMKVLGDGFSYVEEGRLDRKAGVWTWKMTPSTLASKLRNEGSVRVEKIDDNRVTRVTELICEAKVFGIGGLIESSTEKEMRAGWDLSARYMNKWLEDHPAGD